MAPVPPPSFARRWFRRLVVLSVVGTGLGALALLALGLALKPEYDQLRDEIVASAEAHEAHAVVHLGWSFPGKVWSAPTPLQDLPPDRAVLHAQARGYEPVCPPLQPGQYCAGTKAVIPREEGQFEPVLLGWLVGPDNELREHLPLEEAPEVLLNALLAGEDAAYRDHHGVDVMGLLRATVINARGGSYRQGASTLTMQVVRGLTSARERTVGRKIREIVQAYALDANVGKDRVLAMYLDAPYLGQDGSYSICGFRAASKHYFGVDVGELTVAQAALLVSILPAPGKYAPEADLAAAKVRRDAVIRRMVEQGFPVGDAADEPVIAGRHPLVPGARFPGYLQATRLAVEAAVPKELVYGAGLEVHTAMDVVAQAQSESLLADRTGWLDQYVGRASNGPVVVAAALVDPRTGFLVAAHDTASDIPTNFNRVTQARRQAGSSFKPLVYALGFAPGPDGKPKHRADDKVPNMSRTFENTNGWRPKNLGGRYSVTSSLVTGLAGSQNIATASLLEEAGGPEPLLKLAQDIGFDTKGFPHEMGLALGQAEATPLEMARFVATVVGGGSKIAATPLVRVVDADGTVVHAPVAKGDPVLTPEQAILTRFLMQMAVEWGTGGQVKGQGGFPGYPGPLAGKTGTTDDEKDLWFIGGSPTYAGAIWLGHDVPGKLGGAASDIAAPLFGWWFHAVHEGLPMEKFDDSRVHKFMGCTQTGLYPGPECIALPTPLLDDDKPRGVCDGSHGPETGNPIGDYVSMWERMELVKLAQEQGIELGEDGLPVSEPIGPDGEPMHFVHPKPKAKPGQPPPVQPERE